MIAQAAEDRSRARSALSDQIGTHHRPPLALATEPRGLGPYRGYAEMLLGIEAIVERGAHLEVVGASVQGRPIFALVVGPRTGAPTGRKSTAVLSGVHPEEWIGIEAHLCLLGRLVDDPPPRAVVCVPIVNPDGVLTVEDHLRAGRRRFVRHNARGVDLNRNFPAHWRSRGLRGRLLRRLFAPGQGPASEPETRAVVMRLSGLPIDRALSLHSFGGAVLWPPAASLRAPLDAPAARRWARAIARGADPRRPYRAVQCSWWVPGVTNGGLEIDWFYERHGALALLVECARGGLRFRRARCALDPFAWFNAPDPHRVVPPLVEAVLPYVRGDPLRGGG